MRRRFSWPFTVSTSSEKTSPPLERKSARGKDSKPCAKLFARRVLFKRKVRTFQNAIPLEQARLRPEYRSHTEECARARRSLLRVREALLHANQPRRRHGRQSTTTTGRCCATQEACAQTRHQPSISMSPYAPGAERSKQLESLLRARRITCLSTDSLLIERLKGFNVGNQSRAIASHRFHMHPLRQRETEPIPPSRMQNRKPTVSRQRKRAEGLPSALFFARLFVIGQIGLNGRLAGTFGQKVGESRFATSAIALRGQTASHAPQPTQ